MNFIMNKRSRLDRIEGKSAIRTDRELLTALDMSDALAGNYLGKSRQALHMKLGPSNSGGNSRPYFKIPELVLLIMAALQRGHAFDRKAVQEFVESTADGRPPSEESLGILKQLLGGGAFVDVQDAGTIAMILPDFADQRAELPELSEDLRRLAENLAQLRPIPWVAVFSSTIVQARMAAEWLELPEARTRVFRHDYVDNFMPSLLVFSRTGGPPRPYLLTELGGIVPAPQFRANKMAEYVRYMLPAEARDELFDYEDEEVRRRKRA